jgi:hypothetical protein
MVRLLGLLLALLAQTPHFSYALSIQPRSRRTFVHEIASSLTASAVIGVLPALADEANIAEPRISKSKLALSDEQLKQIVQSDLVDRQFLVTANLTPTIYRSTATFTDEIDTYGMSQWIKGTQRLFVASKSNVRLIGDVSVSPDKIEFRFDEDLCFNIPFQPVVALSGKVVLERDQDGFITSYREFWDQDIATVFKTAKFT